MSTNSRPALTRRSCDQCRARKIGCDRGLPCSNCQSARVDCTHSTIASRPSTSKQRVLISSEYERKLDDIARNVDSIKHLLQGRDATDHDLVVQKPNHPTPQSHIKESNVSRDDLSERTLRPLSAIAQNPSRRDHSAYIIDFIKAVVEDRSISDGTNIVNSPKQVHILSSLRNLVAALESPDVTQAHLSTRGDIPNNEGKPTLPPMGAVLEILRWTKDRENSLRVIWICRFLALKHYEDICCKLYFTIREYTDIDFIIANSFLSYMFAEHANVCDNSSSADYAHLCRDNLCKVLSQIPLLLPATQETIAALTLSCLHAIEESKASKAWALISSAMNMCQTLKYHRLGPARDGEGHHFAAQRRLFWVVYTYEGALSLRLGRSSGIRDSDINLPVELDESRYIQAGRVQRRIQNDLYSPAGLSSPLEKRLQVAQELAEEAQRLIDDDRDAIREAETQPDLLLTDPMKSLYLRCDLVCHYSILSLILRAIPVGPSSELSEDCIAAARETMSLHRECVNVMRSCEKTLLLEKYVSWGVLHTPFTAFSILFYWAVQFCDKNDLELLESFAESLRPTTNDEVGNDTPYGVYDLLAQVARLYIESNSLPHQNSTMNTLPTWSPLTTNTTMQVGHDIPPFELQDYSMLDLGEWYYNNQQLMSLLDENAMF